MALPPCESGVEGSFLGEGRHDMRFKEPQEVGGKAFHSEGTACTEARGTVGKGIESDGWGSRGLGWRGGWRVQQGHMLGLQGWWVPSRAVAGSDLGFEGLPRLLCSGSGLEKRKG